MLCITMSRAFRWVPLLTFVIYLLQSIGYSKRRSIEFDVHNADNRDFAFFCVRTNETSASSQFAQLFSLAKTLQRSGT